jgi:hypothetical protein
MSRIPNFLDNRLTDGGDVVSFKHPQRFTPRNILSYSFLLEAESNSRVTVRPEGLGYKRINLNRLEHVERTDCSMAANVV